VLILKHDSDGALGLVLNRLAPLPFQAVWKKLSTEPCPVEAQLYIGGPCAGPLMALHNMDEFGDLQVPNGVYFTAEIPRIREMVSREESKYRLFGGYSGWGPEQLDNEMSAGGWLLAPAESELIFGPHEELWEILMLRLRELNRLSDLLHIKHVPPEPWMN
jgi:putative transcriptional regulator